MENLTTSSRDKEFFLKIVTRDETWVHHRDPLIKWISIAQIGDGAIFHGKGDFHSLLVFEGDTFNGLYAKRDHNIENHAFV